MILPVSQPAFGTATGAVRPLPVTLKALKETTIEIQKNCVEVNVISS
jgi:hypothetical protein